MNPVNNADGSDFGVSHDHLPIGTIPLLATASSPEYAHAVNKFVGEANRIYSDFLHSEDGINFCGQVGGKGRLKYSRCVLRGNLKLLYEIFLAAENCCAIYARLTRVLRGNLMILFEFVCFLFGWKKNPSLPS